MVAPLARAFPSRVPDKEEGVRKLGIQRAGDLAGVAVLPEGVPVVGEHDQHGVVQDSEPLRLVQEVPEPVVGHRHLGRVTRVHPLELGLGEPVGGTRC